MIPKDGGKQPPSDPAHLRLTLRKDLQQAFSVHLQKVPQEGQRTGARREVAIESLWRPLDRRIKSPGEQSKEKEHVSLWPKTDGLPNCWAWLSLLYLSLSPHPLMQHHPFPGILQECELSKRRAHTSCSDSQPTCSLIPLQPLPRCWQRHRGSNDKVHESVLLWVWRAPAVFLLYLC